MNKSQWMDEEFETTVTGALVACYETKVKKSRKTCPEDRMNDARLAILRARGPYIPHDSRLVVLAIDGAGQMIEQPTFDLVNDTLPTSGIFGHPMAPHLKMSEIWKNSYFHAHLVRRVERMSKGWSPVKHGYAYESIHYFADNSGKVDGERSFFTVTRQGEVHSAVRVFVNNRGYCPGQPDEVRSTPDDLQNEISMQSSIALQFLADQRFVWGIQAQDGLVKCKLGCLKDEIKSLLYARSLPVTETGRKKPILHLVAAHQRRIRNGIDVDITAFLRGVPKVEIGTTVFTVQPPQVLAPAVSQASQKFFPVGAN